MADRHTALPQDKNTGYHTNIPISCPIGVVSGFPWPKNAAILLVYKQNRKEITNNNNITSWSFPLLNIVKIMTRVDSLVITFQISLVLPGSNLTEHYMV